MLAAKIQKDLFEFIEKDPEDAEGLILFWYMQNSVPLSAALQEDTGIKLMINISNFERMEYAINKLFLIADTIVIRDTRKRDEKEIKLTSFPLINDYRPGYIDEIGKDLFRYRPSPFTIIDQPLGGYWTSTSKTFNNGFEAVYAHIFSHCIPGDFIEWIRTKGEKYLTTGEIIYAPFIPPLEHESELLRKNISMADYFNSIPCFHQNIPFFNELELNTFLQLDFPFIDNIDLNTLTKIKQDYNDEFKNFSLSIRNSLSRIRSIVGTTDYIKEVQYIQKNDIEGNIDKIQSKIKKINNMSTLRKLGTVIGLLGIDIAICNGFSLPTSLTALSPVVLYELDKIIAGLKEKNELKDNNAYFLWKFGQIKNK